MTQEFSRADRVGSAMQRELSGLIRDMKDPPPGLITIQEVRVSRDLAHAKVYFTVLGGDIAPTQERLQHAAGYFRRELGHAMRLRMVPELQFVHDRSLEEGERIDSLIDAAVELDARHHSNENPE